MQDEITDLIEQNKRLILIAAQAEADKQKLIIQQQKELQLLRGELNIARQANQIWMDKYYAFRKKVGERFNVNVTLEQLEGRL